MRRNGSAVYLSIAVALYCGALLLAQAGGQGAPAGRGGGPPGQGGFVAYPQRPVTDQAAVDRGKALFSVNCAFCHGPDARGGDSGGPNLMRSDVVLLDDKGERIGQVVKQGRPDKGMPPFMLADGNPAQTRTLNKVGLERNSISSEAQSALKQAYKILFRGGLTVSNALARIEAELPALPEIQHLVAFARCSERGLSK